MTSDSGLAAAQVPDVGAVHTRPCSSQSAAVKPTASTPSLEQLDTPDSSFFGTVSKVGGKMSAGIVCSHIVWQRALWHSTARHQTCTASPVAMECCWLETHVEALLLLPNLPSVLTISESVCWAAHLVP